MTNDTFKLTTRQIVFAHIQTNAATAMAVEHDYCMYRVGSVLYVHNIE